MSIESKVASLEGIVKSGSSVEQIVYFVQDVKERGRALINGSRAT